MGFDTNAIAGMVETAEGNGEPYEEPNEAMRRTLPEPGQARSALVTQWSEVLDFARKHHKAAFERMREDMDFARGKQWPQMKSGEEMAGLTGRWDDPTYYTANIVQRHVQQRVSALYARNPKSAVKPKARMDATVWDGTPGQLMQAQQLIMQAMQVGQPPSNMAVAIVEDFKAVSERRKNAVRLSRTLELALDHFVGEQATSFKSSMKSAVRRTVTTGVAFIKIGFQREMEMRPETDARINDASTRLAVLERLTAELADGEVDEYSAEAEQLRLTLKALETEPDAVKREGLVYDFPPSTSILVDPRCKRLRGFVGADWVGQEYLMSPEEVMEVYGVDVRQGGHAAYGGGEGYRAGQVSRMAAAAAGIAADGEAAKDTDSQCLVTEIYSRKDGLVYHHCEGYPDFLREPAPPEYFLERFWPWVPLVFNECEHHTELYPPSDVALIRDMQIEFNRNRQGLREHRKASRPKVVVPTGALEDEDRLALSEHPEDGIAVVELKGLAPGQKIDDLLQSFRPPGIDPNVYDVKQVFEDILRVVGAQEANLGPAGGDGTATESAIAESSRMSALSSIVDELEDVLTEIAKSSAQVLLSEVSEPIIKDIVIENVGAPSITKERVLANLSTKVGQPYSERTAEQDIREIGRAHV